MDRKKHKITTPDYNKIYHDILTKKCPEKIEQYQYFFYNDKKTFLDIINFNRLIFGKNEEVEKNQAYKSYDVATILSILHYQTKYKLNNTQLAQHFRLSRNTITKWKKRSLTQD